MRYRAKPVVIEAMQFIATDNDRVQKILEWAGRPPVTAEGYDPETNHFEYLEVHTLEGVMRADNGDYIIRGTAGEFYPCKPEIFEAKYEPIGQQEGS